jgi:hypothetical protein
MPLDLLGGGLSLTGNWFLLQRRRNIHHYIWFGCLFWRREPDFLLAVGCRLQPALRVFLNDQILFLMFRVEKLGVKDKINSIPPRHQSPLTLNAVGSYCWAL